MRLLFEPWAVPLESGLLGDLLLEILGNRWPVRACELGPPFFLICFPTPSAVTLESQPTVGACISSDPDGNVAPRHQREWVSHTDLVILEVFPALRL